jgi:hypothetical protein
MVCRGKEREISGPLIETVLESLIIDDFLRSLRLKLHCSISLNCIEANKLGLMNGRKIWLKHLKQLLVFNEFIDRNQGDSHVDEVEPKKIKSW